jgi:amino acid adenylation domain-containing protein
MVTTLIADTLRVTAVKKTAVEFDPFAGPKLLRLVPITESQAEIWAACLIGGDDANRAYNESVTLRFTGPLDRAALEHALASIVQRHESLRSAFSADGKCSCVFQEMPIELACQDISTVSAAEQAQLVATYLRQDSQHLFNLLDGPLLKAGLLRLAAEEHHFVLTVHHIICDGWSLGILLQDLGRFYSAYCQKQHPNLFTATPFSQYADQQLVFSRSPAYQEIEQFWLDQYQGDVPVLTLPTDFSRSAVRTYQSARADYPLAPELVAEVKKIGISAGCSFVTTLLAAFEVLLYQLTGQDELVVGLPAAGQSATGMPRLVGHCVNLLPLRSHPRSDISFTEYLRQRKTAIFDAYEHQQLTFGSLLKKLRLARDASRVPLVPVVFNIDLGLANEVKFYGLAYQLISNPRAYENFELFLNASGSEQALTLEWSYNTALFKPETIANMMAGFRSLLREIGQKPTASLWQLTLGNAAALALDYQALNASAQPYPHHKALHQLIAEQAQATPHYLALKFRNTEFTYAALDKKANQLANYLRYQGVQAADVVAIAVERSPELMIALLATMKCGAIYVPLDPTYPQDRLEFMLTDSVAKFVLSSAQTAPAFATSAQTILIGTALSEAASYSDQEPSVRVSSEQILYILYTSGSTGKPKGVQITHRNVVNFLCSMRQEPGIIAADKLLAITTISFDIAGLELFLPLVSGAAVILADAAATKDGKELLRLMQDEQITLMQATPASWRMLLNSGWDAPLPLKALCGGEALPLDLAKQLLSKSQSVWNLYGPTETTIWSSVKKLNHSDQLITIGRPIANTQFYVLDEHQHPVAAGEIGELCITGDGVAQGYLQRPALTAEKFIANPYSDQLGALLYRTGDLGRLLDSGDLQCLGRIDHQVKIRGYRIELGEIEQALMALDDVREAVVIAHEPYPNDERLLAYVVPTSDCAALNQKHASGLWRKALQKQLPAFMVPHDFMIVATLPLTLNGKVDRKALLPQVAHTSVAPTTLATRVAPRTDVEKIVATIWQECLRVKEVDVFDDFFEIGGHSLIAVQVMNRLENATGKRLPLSTLFEHSTVEKLAAVLELDSKSITWDSLVPIKTHGTKTPLYIVHGAGFNVLIFNALSRNMDPDQPIYGLQAKGLNGIEEPLDSVEAMAAHYVAAITAANPTGPYALAGYSFGGIIAFEMARQLTAAGKTVKFLGMFDTYAYQSDCDYSKLEKGLRKGWFLVKRFLYSFVLLKNNPKRKINAEIQSLKRYTIDRMRYNVAQQYETTFGHPYKLGQMNETAQRNYRLMPQSIAVHLFRNKDKVFYMEDFKYLGWKPFALNGLHIYDIPGDHNRLFAPPHDKESARILQAALLSCE